MRIMATANGENSRVVIEFKLPIGAVKAYAARAGSGATSVFLLRREILASHGNTNRAAAAAVAEPNMTKTPKRSVGGKFESRKMPNPQQITSNDVPIGRHRCEHAVDHGSHELRIVFGEKEVLAHLRLQIHRTKEHQYHESSHAQADKQGQKRCPPSLLFRTDMSGTLLMLRGTGQEGCSIETESQATLLVRRI
jgi:hypothetical protein